MHCLRPTNIDMGAFDRYHCESCRFQKSSNCRHAIVVDMLMDAEIKMGSSFPQFSALLIGCFLWRLDIKVASGLDISAQLAQKVQRMRYVFGDVRKKNK